eukprot:gene11151-3973_t
MKRTEFIIGSSSSTILSKYRENKYFNGSLIFRYLYEKDGDEDDSKIIISHHNQILLKDIDKMRKKKMKMPSIEDEGGKNKSQKKTTKNFSELNEEENENLEIKNEKRKIQKNSSVSTSVGEDLVKNNRKFYWIPDESALNCYDCRTPFTVFIRKHHCRVCGQIFCYQCSNFVVDGERWNYTGKVRCCSYCFKLTKGEKQNLNEEKSSLSNMNLSSFYEAIGGTHNLLNERNETNHYHDDDDDEDEDSVEGNLISTLIPLSDGEEEEEEEEDNLTIDEKIEVKEDITSNIKIIKEEEEEEEIQDESQIKAFESLKNLQENSWNHLKNIIKQFIEQEKIENKEWINLIFQTVIEISKNFKFQDKMDIRNYIKIKKILRKDNTPDIELINGITFSKNVVFKKMKSNFDSPIILLLNCPLEFQRIESKITSLETLIKQEESYLTLMAYKIIEKKPNLVLIEKNASQIVKNILFKNDISLLVNVPHKILKKISNCTNSKIFSSLDEITNLNTDSKCSYKTRIDNKSLYTIESNNFKEFTILLKGNNEIELKKLKKIIKFSTYTAYHLKLETEFFFDESSIFIKKDGDNMGSDSGGGVGSNGGGDMGLSVGSSSSLGLCSGLDLNSNDMNGNTIERKNENLKNKILSISSNVIFEHPIDPNIKLIKSEKNKIESELDWNKLYPIIFNIQNHQNIVVLFSKLIKIEENKFKQHGDPEIIIIAYYTENDMSLGTYLDIKCFNQMNLNETLKTIRTYTHNNRKVTVSVEKLNQNQIKKLKKKGSIEEKDEEEDDLISIWNYCKICQKNVTPLYPLSDSAYHYSFGKFLETSFYNHDIMCRIGDCKHSVHRDHIRCFGYKNIIAKFEFTFVDVYEVFIPLMEFPLNETFHNDKFRILKEQTIQNTKNLIKKRYEDVNLKLFNDLKNEYLNEYNLIKQQFDSYILIGDELNNELNKVDFKSLNDYIKNAYTIIESWNELLDNIFKEEEKMKNLKINKIIVQFEIDEKNNCIKLNLKENIQKKKRTLSQISNQSTFLFGNNNGGGIGTTTTTGTTIGIGIGTGTNTNNNSGNNTSTNPSPNPSPNLNLGINSFIDSCHPYLPNPNPNSTIQTLIFDDEISSIISYTLQTNEYKSFLKSELDSQSLEMIMKSEEKSEFKLNFKDLMKEKDIQLKRTGQDISCTCYYSKQFSALRQSFKNGEDHYLTSLSRCKSFVPTGGKSGSSFIKTWDDRLILKQISRVELNAFLETGTSYFEYMTKILFHELPSLLVKILGVYRIYYTSKSKSYKLDLIVMENLFYSKNISKTFDLKGSIRNRYQTTKDAVQLDENYLESFFDGNPLIIKEPSKALITMSVFNDTLILSKLQVMDYSLLVGVDQENGDLLIGIIDYIRQYTWDKSLETWVKSASIMGNKTKIPTVISPKDYKSRFREAMFIKS